MIKYNKNVLFCSLCIKTKEKSHNSWRNSDEEYTSFRKDDCEKDIGGEIHINGESDKRALEFDKAFQKDDPNIPQFMIIKDNSLNENDESKVNINEE